MMHSVILSDLIILVFSSHNKKQKIEISFNLIEKNSYMDYIRIRGIASMCSFRKYVMRAHQCQDQE